MDLSEEVAAPGEEACGSANIPDESTTSNSPPLTPPRQQSLADPKPRADTTSSKKDLQKSKGKNPPNMRSFPIGPKKNANSGTKCGTSAGPASQGSAGINNKKPMKNIKVARDAPVAIKMVEPFAEPNREPRAALLPRTGRPATRPIKPAPLAKDADKKTIAEKGKFPRTLGLSRGKTIAGIPCSTSRATNVSLSGDSSARQSARDRLSDNNKLKVFEGQLMKLEAAQTEFLRKFETMKAGMQGKCQQEFKFIGMVQGGNCKLVVQEDYLKKIPLKLPTRAVADLKAEIQDILNTCLIAVQEEVMNKGLDIANLEDRLEQEQARRLSSFFAKMNDLCSVPETSETEAKLKKQLLDAKRLADDLQLQINQQKKVHSTEMATREKSSKKEHELQISKKDDAIAELKRKIKALHKEQEKLIQKAQSVTTEQSLDQEQRDKLLQEISSLKDTQLNLTKKLRQNEVAHKSTVSELMVKDAAMAELQKELDECKKIFESVRTHNKAEVSQQLLEKTKEVTMLKENIAQSRNDYAALEKNLRAARKELEAVETSKAQLELYKAHNKKLKQYLLKKEKELQQRPLNPEQYPAEMSSLRKSNNQLKSELEKVSDRAERFRKWNIRLMEEIERMAEMDECRRDLQNELKKTEAEEGERKETPVVNIGVQRKTEELQALCSSLGSQQVEMIRQGHMIKLLQDRHERSEFLRVKQQEEISRLHEEVFALKLAKFPRNIPSQQDEDEN